MPTSNLNAQYLDTIGIELESEGLSRGALLDRMNARFGSFYERGLPLTVTRDASAESMVDYVRFRDSRRGLQIYTHTKLFQNHIGAENRQPIGYELVTNPLPIDEMEKLIYRTTSLLNDMGDFVTDRCAVHYHVGFAHNVRLMKKLLKVCLAIDPLLFRLGGMGRLQRGYSNLSAYARPLLNSAAVPVYTPRERRSMNDELQAAREGLRIRLTENNSEPDHDFDEDEIEEIRIESPVSSAGFVQVINPLEALTANSVNEFWANFSVFPDVMGLSKYHPARYTGCNFYAIPMHGTMEFRHFNQSLDAPLIMSIAKLLRATVEVSTVLTKHQLVEFEPRDPNVEISMDDAEQILSVLLKYFSIHEIENAPDMGDIDIILSTLAQSSFKELPVKPVQTHNNEFRVPGNLVGKLIPVDKPLKPKHVDIHTIKYSSILGANT